MTFEWPNACHKRGSHERQNCKSRQQQRGIRTAGASLQSIRPSSAITNSRFAGERRTGRFRIAGDAGNLKNTDLSTFDDLEVDRRSLNAAQRQTGALFVGERVACGTVIGVTISGETQENSFSP